MFLERQKDFLEALEVPESHYNGHNSATNQGQNQKLAIFDNLISLPCVETFDKE